MTINMLEDVESLSDIPSKQLIRRFEIQSKSKKRQVNNPIPELKSILKSWNEPITEYYEKELLKHNISEIPHAHRPNKSIRTNAEKHVHSTIIQFDFKGFYDSCKFDYFKNVFITIDKHTTKNNVEQYKRLLIDPNTNGLTQGLPVSGVLAGISLIPFWTKLKTKMPKNVIFTQYSDDLTFSFTGKRPKMFTIKTLTRIIYQTLKEVHLNFKLNDKKTREESEHYRKITGIRINNKNQITPSRKDYRFLRMILHILATSDDLEKEIKVFGFKSKAAFVGKISYMRSIDSSGKINKIIFEHRQTCKKHQLFEKWIDAQYKMNAFA